MNASSNQGRGNPIWLIVILALAAAVQIWFAGNKGLVLDEFHTHFHATRDGWSAFWETLVKDNHPPLSFLVIGASARLFGDGEIALRLPAMLFALVEIALIWRLARDHGRAGAGIAAALLAASSLHLDFATQARMYSLHSLAVIGCAAAITRLLSGECTRGTRISLGLWFWIGLHNHYFFVQYSIGLAFGAALAACFVPATRPRLRSLIIPIGAAVLLALPWYLSGFLIQWGHALPPGGDDVGVIELIEAYVHLFFLNVRLASELPLVGSIMRGVFISCGGILTLLALLGACRGFASTQSTRTRATTAVMFSVAFVVPCAALLLAAVLPRAGFTWHYVLPSAAAEAWLIAVCWRHGSALGPCKLAILAALAAAVLLSILNAQGRGSQDFPGAVVYILEQHEPGDAIVSVEWQPPLFPQGMPWDYYAPRLHGDPPERLAMNEHHQLSDAGELDGALRVLVLRTSLPRGQHLFKLLERRGLREVHHEEYGFGIMVMVYE